MERLNRTFKDEHTRRSITPLRRDDARARWSRYFDWYNEHRPHEALNGRTPNEVYYARAPANEAPRVAKTRAPAVCAPARDTAGRSRAQAARARRAPP
ncbi:MAG: transposase [Dechloromonas sp.]|nr:transposase [Dechloromonas sp.]